MSEQDVSNTTEDAPEAAEDAPTTDAPESTEETGKDESWDPEKAKRLIAQLREEVKAVKSDREPQSDKDRRAIAALKRQLSELEAKAPKPEVVEEKDKRIADLETTSLRYEIALDLELPRKVANLLQGSNREEMVAHAEELMELFSPTKRPTTQRPTEALRGGLEPDKEPEETDTRKIAERMFRN